MKMIAVAFLALAGCASQMAQTTQARFEDLAAMQIGMTEPQIIDRLGPPASAHDVDGLRYLTWSNDKQVAPAYSSHAIGYSVLTIPRGGGTYSCALTYKMEPRQVINLTDPDEPETTQLVATSYTSKGNNCRD